jgi:hypothetical protein
MHAEGIAMSDGHYQPGNRVNGICFLGSMAFLLWAMRSGALAMWDRSSPLREGPVIPWVLAVPLAVIGGAVMMPLITFQIGLLVEWWQRKRRGS